VAQAYCDKTFDYDVFISYSSHNHKWVREWLLPRLEDGAGLRACIDYRDFEIGVPNLINMERAVERSKKILLILTPNWIESEWTNFESLLAQADDPSGLRQRILPIKLVKCDPPKRISILTYADFTNESQHEIQLLRIISAIKKERVDTCKPAAVAPKSEASAIKIHYGNSYLLKENFSGRVHERKLLSDWLNGDNHQILALTAIGGMGKSALAWAWLHRDVLHQNTVGMLPDTEEDAKVCKVSEGKFPESVFWWSFYEQESSFGKFLDWLASEIAKEIPIPDSFSCTYDKIKEVVNVLRDHRFLLVLDGFERELRAYSTLNAAYQEAIKDNEGEDFDRCTDLNAAIFLRSLAAFPLKSKILLTSRIIPFELTEAGSCKEEKLKGLDSADAVRFFHSIGIEGSRADIENACEPYEYHPLALRILAGLICYHPEHPMDIKAAASLDPIPKLKQREHHILDLAYRQLLPDKRMLLSRMAAFRSPMPYGVVKVLGPIEDDIELREALMELEKRNLIQFDRERARYDLHQVVREYAYKNLDNKIEIHTKLKDYLSSVSDPKIVKSLDDLTDLIELYHHTVNSGFYDDAIDLFKKRLTHPIYDHFGAYQICIKLLRGLFPDGEDLPPKLSSKDSQGYVLNLLALCYGCTGQSKHAEKVLEIAIPFAQTTGNRATAHGNLSYQQMTMGKLIEAEKNGRTAVKLSQEVNDMLDESTYHLILGELFAYSGDFSRASREVEISENLYKKYNNKFKRHLNPSRIFRYRTKIFLLAKNFAVAERTARKALKLEYLVSKYKN